jgi:arsenate reductase
VSEAALDQWLKALGWEALVNSRGTTWRQLGEAKRAAVVDAASARTLMLNRSVVEWGQAVTAGFDAVDWQRRV